MVVLRYYYALKELEEIKSYLSSRGLSFVEKEDLDILRCLGRTGVLLSVDGREYSNLKEFIEGEKI